MLRAQTHCDLSPYLSLHISVCALVSACCSFLPSCTQRRSSGTQDPPPPPTTALLHMHTCARAASNQLLPPASGRANPVGSGPRAQGINNLHALSAAPGAPGWCETIESDLIPTLAFCQQRLRSDGRDGSPAPAPACCSTSHADKQGM